MVGGGPTLASVRCPRHGKVTQSVAGDPGLNNTFNTFNFHIIEMMSNPFCNFAFDSNGNTIFATYFHIFTRQYKDAFHLRI